MASRHAISDIEAVIEAYFEGLYYADSEKLAEVFHRDARYVNMVENDYMNLSTHEYFDLVDHRAAPASSREERADRILSIEIAAAGMAFVKASMTMLGRNYLDFLTLVLDGNEWRIMSKVFTYSQQPKEK